MASSADGAGYAMLTAFGKLFAYGDFPNDGDESAAVPRPADRGDGRHPDRQGY